MSDPFFLVQNDRTMTVDPFPLTGLPYICISMPVVIGTDSSQHRRKKLCRNIANKELIDLITVSYMILIFKIERELTCMTDRTNSWDDVQLPPEP